MRPYQSRERTAGHIRFMERRRRAVLVLAHWLMIVRVCGKLRVDGLVTPSLLPMRQGRGFSLDTQQRRR